MEYPDLSLKGTTLSGSPSSSSLSSSTSGLSDSLHLHETPGTTPGEGSENGDAFPFFASHHGHDVQLPRSPRDEFILVTGGLGYIGSHTTLELMKQGYNVIVVDNLTNCFASTRWRIQHLAAQHCAAHSRPTPQLHFHKLDYQSPAMRLLLEQYTSFPLSSDSLSASPDADQPPHSQITSVIHFAAYKSVSESILNPLSYYENNVCGLVGFIRLLSEFNIHNFIFSSSATIYGSKANASKPLVEDEVVHYPKQGSSPDSVIEPNVSGLTCAYARTKYFCEAILADVAKSDPDWRITALRYFNPVGCDASGLLGESPRNQPTNLFPVVAEVLSGKRENLDIFGSDWPTRDGTAIRDYVHVGDIARGHVAALMPRDGDDTEGFRTYNLGSGTGTSVLEIVESLSKAAEREVPVQWAGRRPGDVGFCIANTERAERELGWTPRESISQSARDLWNYIRGLGVGSDGKKPMVPGQC